MRFPVWSNLDCQTNPPTGTETWREAEGPSQTDPESQRHIQDTDRQWKTENEKGDKLDRSELRAKWLQNQ